MEIGRNLEFVEPKDLRALLDKPRELTVSIYHPTNRVAVEPEENSLHLKNLLRRAEKMLIDEGLRSPKAAKFLEPAASLLGNDDFWLHQLEALAIFVDEQGKTVFRLPEQAPEVVSVSQWPAIKPMLASIFPNVQFYLLALSLRNVRLLNCSRHTAEEIDLSQYDFPRSIDESLRYDVREGTDPRQMPRAGPGIGTPTRPTGVEDRSHTFHGHGDAGEDQHEKARDHFTHVARILDKVLGTEHVPLVLAGVEWVQAIYRDVSSYRPILDEYVEGNPDRRSVKDLHAQTLPIIDRHRMSEVDAWKEDFGALMARERASTELKEILFNAQEARIARLFIRDGTDAVWGKYDVTEDSIEVHDERLPGDSDLHDFAARQAVLTDGEALLVPGEHMPAGGPIAATYRW